MMAHSVKGHKLKITFNEQLRQGSKEGLRWVEILVQWKPIEVVTDQAFFLKIPENGGEIWD